MTHIARCESDLFHDDRIDPVDYNASDRFCLNGQRLVLLNPSDTYGGNGVEYRTATEEFSRIVSVSDADGPTTFKVWKKNGDYYEYGLEADAQVKASNQKAIRSWAIKYIYDRWMNYIQFDYTYDRDIGKHQISKIRYTGQKGSNGNPDLPPLNEVRFEYEPRADGAQGFHVGATLRSTERVKRITTHAFDSTNNVLLLAREYRLTYGASASTGKSRIESVMECGSDGTCFRPTKFTWSAPGAGGLSALNTAKVTPEMMSKGKAIVASGDFNGDGITDLLWMPVYANKLHYWNYQPGEEVWLGRRDGGFDNKGATGLLPGTNWWWGLSMWWGSRRVAAVGDFNGDGLTDIFWQNTDDRGNSGSGQKNILWLSKGDGTFEEKVVDFFSVKTGVTGQPDGNLSIPSRVAVSGDFNGDGRTDLLILSTDIYGRIASGVPGLNFDEASNLAQVWISNKDGTFTRSNLAPGEGPVGNQFNNHSVVATGDFNGDGLTDFIVMNTDPYSRWTRQGDNATLFLSDGAGKFKPVALKDRAPVLGASGAAWAWHQVVSVGDFNGDGLTDIIIGRLDNHGRLVGSEQVVGYDTSKPPSCDDYSCTYPPVKEWRLDVDLEYWFSKGDGSFERQMVRTTGGPLGKEWQSHKIAAVGDFNGDGIPDFYMRLVDGDGNGIRYGSDRILLGSVDSNVPSTPTPADGFVPVSPPPPIARAPYGPLKLKEVGLPPGSGINWTCNPNCSGVTLGAIGDFNGDGGKYALDKGRDLT